MTFRDGQDTGTDGDCRYGGTRSVNTALGYAGAEQTAVGAGVTRVILEICSPANMQTVR